MKELDMIVRKQKVWELSTTGFTQEQIAQKLNVSLKTISRDYAELKQESQKWFDNLPRGEIQIEHKKTFETIKTVIQQLWEIYHNSKDEAQKVKILDTISKKSEMYLKIMGMNSMDEVKWRIKSLESSAVEKLYK